MLAELLVQEDNELSLLAALNIANFSSDPHCQLALVQQNAAKALVVTLHKGSVEVQKVALQVRQARYACFSLLKPRVLPLPWRCAEPCMESGLTLPCLHTPALSDDVDRPSSRSWPTRSRSKPSWDGGQSRRSTTWFR